MSLSHIEWKPDYCLGNDVIDAQHLFLFDLANDAMAEDCDEDLQGLVLRLFRYTREHFEAEERFMQAMAYPALAAHREEHNDLIERLGDLRASCQCGPGFVRECLRSFMEQWIVGHILESDRKILQYKDNA